MSALKSVSLGSTSLAAMSTDATTGASDRRERSIWGRQTVPQHVENVLSAEALVPMSPCGWAASPPCT